MHGNVNETKTAVESEEKEERKPGSLNFLSSEDQLKVQRLLDLCEGNMQTDVATQTDTALTMTDIKLKDVATQAKAAEITNPEFYNESCNCQEKVLENLEIIKRMLEENLRKQAQTNHQPQVHPMPNDISSFDCTFLVDSLENTEACLEVSDESTDPMQPLTPRHTTTSDSLATPSSCTNSFETPNTPTTPNFPSTTPKSTTSINSTTTSISSTSSHSNSIIPSDTYPQTLFEDVFRRSSSMPNYAKNLVFELFERQELLGKNCAGVKGKAGIGCDPRMDIVRENTFKRFRVTDKNATWAVCRKAIDTALRKMKQ